LSSIAIITIVAIVVVVVVHHTVAINVVVIAVVVVVHPTIIVIVVVVVVYRAVAIIAAPIVVVRRAMPSTSLSLPVASSPSLLSTSLSITIIFVNVVIRPAVAIIVDIQRTVTIVVNAVARRALTIIVDNSKTPAHRQWQQRHRDEGNNAIVTTVKTPVHQRQ